MAASIPVILHPAGIQAADVTEYGQVPVQSEAGLGIVRDPAAGSFIAMCALPGMFTASGAPKFGYLSLRKRSAGAAVSGTAGKIRIPTLDCPDGPA